MLGWFCQSAGPVCPAASSSRMRASICSFSRSGRACELEPEGSEGDINNAAACSSYKSSLVMSDRCLCQELYTESNCRSTFQSKVMQPGLANCNLCSSKVQAGLSSIICKAKMSQKQVGSYSRSVWRNCECKLQASQIAYDTWPFPDWWTKHKPQML